MRCKESDDDEVIHKESDDDKVIHEESDDDEVIHEESDDDEVIHEESDDDKVIHNQKKISCILIKLNSYLKNMRDRLTFITSSSSCITYHHDLQSY